MNEAEAIEIVRDALFTTIIVSLPLMLIALVVGLAISLFQALTQLQEQTLTFVPKILIMFTAMVFLLPFMNGHLRTFTERIMDRIVAVGTGVDSQDPGGGG
ncbi:flagellar biosynthesis protein FliQ [Niveispirillum sp.]|uniref:flagellar biosynthesis protein FliQ n=1 Tax=Niveispirillum sp. TaxID=1917217 RepID=UPI001B3E5EC6|nr:flagellar biosynthesis protein FliQ [Niveispirillum sp.]MBP7336427.1 flagellar biosynthesis protein FliQ [Niveispirillum sp.]